MGKGIVLLSSFVALTALASPVLVPMPQEVRETGGCLAAAVEPKVTLDAKLPKEGYSLSVTAEGVKVTAADEAGAYWARQTLRQLETVRDGKTVVPCVEVRDWPAFAWRGFLLDVSRHFFTVEEVKRVLDQMAYHKLNVLHWHLTDGPGWRVQIDRYPELMKQGATRGSLFKRTSRYMRDATESRDGKYGPFFYTKAQVREIVAYAAARHIRVMPEIEIPGHSNAAIAAYRFLTCPDGGGELCIGNDETLRFYENVLDEVCELFPDEFVHIGGDECSTAAWAKCPKCQARKRALGLKDEHELQYWITRHFADYLAKKGKRILGWDEIALADLPKSAAVMKWRVGGKADEAAKRGHDIVLTSSSMTYVDYPQGLAGDPLEYPAFAPHLSARRMYTLDPYHGMPEAIRPRLLGGEGAAWTEITATMKELEWKSWPRMGVVAEIFWRNEAVKDRKPDDFLARLAAHRERLVGMGVNAAPLGPDVPPYVEVAEGVKVPWSGATCTLLTDAITEKTSGVEAVRDASLKAGEFNISMTWLKVTIAYADEAALKHALAVLNRVSRSLGPGAVSVPQIGYEYRAPSVRYLAADGDDAKDGLTPQTAWRSLAKLNRDLPAGAEARLRSGDTFYGSVALKSGPDAAHPTVLTSWGEGPKPEISAYKIAKPDPAAWRECGGNRWSLDLADSSKFTGNVMSRDGNVGFLKVDGRIFGRKIFKVEKLAAQWDFYEDGRTVTVWSAKNPAQMAKEIKIAPNVHIVPFHDHIILRGLTLRGTGGHGTCGVGRGATIVDCEYREIGGSTLRGYGNGTTRYGNGIECWAGSTDVQVRRCVITDVYDVAFTMQGGQPSRSWEQTHVTDCTIERCSQAYELWSSRCAPGIGMRNCSFQRNRVVDTAYGWAYDVRPDKVNATPLLMYGMDARICDILVRDNTFINSRGYLIFKSGGLADLPESYRVVDNVVVGPVDRAVAYCVGNQRAAVEQDRARRIRAANVFKPVPQK